MFKTTMMNIITIVAYCIVFLFTVSLGTVGYLWLSGSFNLHSQPVEGLKFNVNKIEISENGGSAIFKVLSSQAVVTGTGENQIIDDPAERVDIVIEVWDSAGVVQDSNLIVDVDTTGKLCDDLTVTARVDAEDLFNLGGVCYLHAYTANELYFATPIPVYVDVPIDSVELIATDTVSGQVFNLDPTADDYTKFVKGDEFLLSINVYPSRALNPYNIEGEDKQALYESGAEVTFVSVVTSENQGIVSVNASNDRSGSVDLSVKIPKTYANETDLLTADIDIYVAPLQLQEIVIRNDAVTQMDYSATVTLFSNHSTKISAEDTGDASITNLDIFLKPIYYNANTNANPLQDRIQSRDLKMTYTSSLESSGNATENMPNLFTILPADVTDENNIIWTITANRELENGETATLVITYQQLQYDDDGVALKDDEGVYVYLPVTVNLTCNVEINVPENVEFFDSNLGQTLTTLTLNITKDVEGSEEVVESGDNRDITTNGLLSMGTNTSGESYTYSKIVYFVTSTSLTNEANYYIVNVTQYGQIVFSDTAGNLIYNSILQPLGSGTVKIKPYLIRTDKNGNPINADYTVLSDLDAVTGVSETGGPTDYVLIREYSALTINVKESLTDLTLYTDSNLSDDLKLDSITTYWIGTTSANAVTLYAKGNSALALPKSLSDYNKISGTNPINIIASVDSSKPYATFNIINLNFMQVTVDSDVYNLMEFTVLVNFGAEETADNVVAEIHISANNADYTSLKLKARDVKVTGLDISTANSGIENYITFDIPNQSLINLNTLSLNSNLVKNGSQGNYYYKVEWGDTEDNKYLLPVTYTAEDVSNFTIEEEVGEDTIQKTLYTSGDDLVATKTGMTIKTYFANVDENVYNKLNIIDKTKIMRDGSTLHCTLSNEDYGASMIDLISATDYVSIYGDTQVGNTRIYQIQFKQTLPTDKVLVIVYEYDTGLESVYYSTSQYIVSPDFFIVNAHYPSVDFVDLASTPIITSGNYESLSTVVQLGSVSDFGSAYYKSENLNDSLIFTIDTNARNYFSIGLGEDLIHYVLALKTGYVMQAEQPTGASSFVQLSITQVTITRSIKIVLDLTDTQQYTYYISDSITLDLPYLAGGNESGSPLFSSS